MVSDSFDFKFRKESFNLWTCMNLKHHKYMKQNLKFSDLRKGFMLFKFYFN